MLLAEAQHRRVYGALGLHGLSIQLGVEDYMWIGLVILPQMIAKLGQNKGKSKQCHEHQNQMRSLGQKKI